MFIRNDISNYYNEILVIIRSQYLYINTFILRDNLSELMNTERQKKKDRHSELK